MKRFLQFLKRLFMRREPPMTLPQIPPYVPPSQERMDGAMNLDPQKFDSELPEGHALRAIKGIYERWGLSKKPSEKELSE